MKNNTKTLLFALASLSFAWPTRGQQAPVAAPVDTVKIPWDGFDLTWVNGNDRRDSSVFHIPYFTPSILIDCNTTHSFNNPIDHTVVGSTALSRNDEMVISAINFGGDFSYGNARGRIMTQFGMRSQVVPRNDLSLPLSGRSICRLPFQRLVRYQCGLRFIYVLYRTKFLLPTGELGISGILYV